MSRSFTPMSNPLQALREIVGRATAGPWSTRGGEHDTVAYIQSGRAAQIADVHSFSVGFGPGRQEREANAALIVAAVRLARAITSDEAVEEVARALWNDLRGRRGVKDPLLHHEGLDNEATFEDNEWLKETARAILDHLARRGVG